MQAAVEETFLIADDDLGDRMATRRILRALKPEADIIEFDGAQNTQMSFDRQPTVAFIDYNMPRCSGIDLVEELLAAWPHVACIIMTGQGDEEIAKDAIRAGAYDYIAKNKLAQNPIRRILEGANTWRQMQLALHEQRAETDLFAAVLLHDVKAPVRSIKFFAQEIEDTLPQDARDLVSDELRLLMRSTRQIGSLLDSLACHMRVTKDDPLEDHCLADLIEPVLIGLDRTIAEAGVAVSIEVEDADKDHTIHCSKAQIVQMLQNLVANAIKYGKTDAPAIRIIGRRDGPDHVLLTVADNGPGIDPKYHATIFEPFKRGAASTKTEGTGLGLATCVKIARRHGGDIHCESDLGSGASFIARLRNDPQ